MEAAFAAAGAGVEETATEVAKLESAAADIEAATEELAAAEAAGATDAELAAAAEVVDAAASDAGRGNRSGSISR